MLAECNGINLAYELHGPENAPCLVLSHCLAANMGLWEEQVRDLGRSYRILRYNIRGHGSSSAPEGEYSMEELARDLRALLDRLGLDRVHLAGISLGGMIGQIFALNYPGYLQSLTLCDTVCRVAEEALPEWRERIRSVRSHGMEVLVEPTLERWLSPEFREKNPDVDERIAEMIRTTPVSGFVGCCGAISGFDASDRLHAVEVPTWVVVGENDPGTPVQEAKAIQKRIPGAELRVLSHARHLSCVEAAEEFNGVLREALERTKG